MDSDHFAVMPGDLLDVFRNDNDNLLDIDGLADLLDEWTEEAPSDAHAFAPAGYGVVTTDTKPEMQMMMPVLQTAPGSASMSGNNSAEAYSDQTSAAALGRQARKSSSGQEPATKQQRGNGDRKKRTRNQEQMEHNRIAQQKYRERKKMENHELQTALDMLAAELAAMKAFEVRNQELEMTATSLSMQVAMQAQQIQNLELQVTAQSSELSSTKEQLATQQAVSTSQQKMILDQHQRLQLQEEIISNLKKSLKTSVDTAWTKLGNPDPRSVCKKMNEAVKAALEGAKDMEGLQDTLAQIPEHLVVEICKNILAACKDLWPQLASQFDKLHNENPNCPFKLGLCAGAAGPIA